jgi:ankyrin repeat protein
MFNNDKANKTNPLDEYTGPIAPIKRRKKPILRRKSMSVESDASNGTNSRKSPTSGIKLDILKKDSSGRTHLHKFSKRGDAEGVENLLEGGANPNEKDYAGWTALHEAALNGHLEVVKLLLKYGANVNSKGADSDTPLHDATGNNHCDIVELLLEHGADPFARNADDTEPIDIAAENGFQDIVLVLQAANPVVKKKRHFKKETDVAKKKPMGDGTFGIQIVVKLCPKYFIFLFSAYEYN